MCIATITTVVELPLLMINNSMAFRTLMLHPRPQREHIDCCQLICSILFALSLFFIRVATGLLIGKLVFDKEDDKNGDQTSLANWGEMMTQGGVQKSVLEAIVDMMKAENIKKNLR